MSKSVNSPTGGGSNRSRSDRIKTYAQNEKVADGEKSDLTSVMATARKAT